MDSNRGEAIGRDTWASPEETRQAWAEMVAEQQDDLIASGWHPPVVDPGPESLRIWWNQR